jgi:coenzyme Q-binding protein COQ10
MVRGPFTHLENRWTFNELPLGGTHIDFILDFQFRSRMLDRLIGALFDRAARKMVAAFTARAAELYGAG